MTPDPLSSANHPFRSLRTLMLQTWIVRATVVALGVITLFPPWVLRREIWGFGEGYETKHRNPPPQATALTAYEELCPLGHSLRWPIVRSLGSPSVDSPMGSPPGSFARWLDVRLLLTEYALILGVASFLLLLGKRARKGENVSGSFSEKGS